MKKTLYILIFMLVAAGTVSAQDNDNRFRPKYRNISFSSQTVTVEDLGFETEASKYGFGFTLGTSYAFPKDPLFGMLRIGVDATWFDINYGNWGEKRGGDDIYMHKADIGMGVGPGIHINPVSKLGIHVYFRYNPTFTMLFHNIPTALYSNIDDELEIDGGYGSYFTTGGAVSWDLISLGIEARFGKGKYHGFKGEEYTNGEKGYFGKETHKLKGLRAYIGFRF